MPLIQAGGLSQALIGKGQPGSSSSTVTKVMPAGLLLALTHSVMTTSANSAINNAGQASGLLLTLTQAGTSSSPNNAGQISGLSLALTRAS